MVRHRHPRHRPLRQLRFERLETRALPSSTLYLDFGDNFPAGGFELTDGQLGSDLAVGGLSGPSLSYTSATLLRFLPTSQRVTFDFNGSGTVNAQDWIDLRANALALIQRYYAPFDVNVVLAPAINNSSSAAYFAGVQATLNAGPAVTGERDCWEFAVHATVAASGVSVGSDMGIYGIASGRDIGGNNANDDSSLSCTDIVFTNIGNAAADTALASTASHEAAHNFALAHTSDVALSNSDQIVAGGGAGQTLRRNNINFFTRYPLALVGGGTVVNYDRYANTNVLGLKAGAPHYITGTGENDIITVTRLTATTATVSIQAFSDATYTTPVTVPGAGGTTYSYTATFNPAIGLLIEGGYDNDRIVIDATLACPINVRGMASTDQLIVNGGGADGGYTPNATATIGIDGNLSYGGQLDIGDTMINFSEFETGSTVEINGATNLLVRTPSANDVVTVDTVTGGRFRVAGSSNAVAFVPVIADVTTLFVDTAVNDGLTGNDIITAILAGVVTPGRQVIIEAGASIGGGADLITVQSLAANTGLTVNAGAGNDTIVFDSNGAGAGGTVDAILSPITVNGQGGLDSMSFEDSSDATGDTLTVDATNVGLAGDNFYGAGGTVSYSQITTVTLNLSAGTPGDQVTLTPSADTSFNVNANNPTAAPGDRLNLNLEGVTTPLRNPSTSTSGIWTFGNRQGLTYSGVEDQVASATPTVVVGDGTNQRSRVEQLKVVFDHVIGYVGAPTAAYTLEKIAGGVPVGSVSFTVTTVTVGDHSEATISFTSDTTNGSLNDGRYRLTVLGNQVTVSGVALAANTVSDFHRLFGDINGDTLVDVLDFAQFSTSFNLNSIQAGFIAAFDFNDDDIIDVLDFGQFATRLFSALP